MAARDRLITQGDPAEDPREFRRCLGQFSTGVTVMTAQGGGRLAGMSVNSFASVSLDPPLVLWSLRRESGSLPVFQAATYFAVNVLGSDQAETSGLFATPAPDKFERTDWTLGLGGAPLLGGCIATMECAVHQWIDGGDHLVLMGRVERFTRFSGDPLLFAQGRYAVALEHPGTRPPEQQSKTYHMA